MEFLRELYNLVTPGKASKNKKGLGMVPINSFVAGRTDDDGDEVDESAKVVVPVAKPRNKQLHDTLSGRKGGRMTDKKSDYKRTAKHKGKMFETEESAE